MDQPKKSYTWLLALTLFLLLTVLGFFAWKIYSLKSESTPVERSSLVEPIPGWTTYTNINSAVLYQIQYPANWWTETLPIGIGFGPKEISDGTIWGVISYDKTYTRDKIINGIDKFLTDRVQTKEAVTINGIDAIKVITSNTSKSKWSSETVIIETGTNIIVISNSGMSDNELNSIIGGTGDITFEKFYSTFEILN